MRRVTSALLLAALAVMITGCPELNKLRRENVDLKSKLSVAARALQETEQQSALLKSDNDRLKSELLNRVRATPRAAAAAEAPAPKRADVSAALAKEIGSDVKVRTKGQKTIIELPNKVFFASGSANLTSHGKAALKRVAGALRREFPAMMYYVEGHTDNDPIRKAKKQYKTNWELSCARALAVVHHLIDYEGISPKQVCAVGYGEHQPRVPNTTAGNKSKNRRVEIVVAPDL